MWLDFCVFYVKVTLPETRIILIFTVGSRVWPRVSVVAFKPLGKIWNVFLCFVCFKLCKNSAYRSNFGSAHAALIMKACFGCLTINSLHINVCAAKSGRSGTSKHCWLYFVFLCFIFLPEEWERPKFKSQLKVQL